MWPLGLINMKSHNWRESAEARCSQGRSVSSPFLWLLWVFWSLCLQGGDPWQVFGGRQHDDGPSQHDGNLPLVAAPWQIWQLRAWPWVCILSLSRKHFLLDSRFMERLISEFSFHRYEGRNIICKASAQIDRYVIDELAIGIQIVVGTL